MPDPLRVDREECAEGASVTECHARELEARYAGLAAELGIIKPGDRLDQVQIDFAFGVAELCAAIGDRYGDPSDGNAGEHIRALYGPV